MLRSRRSEFPSVIFLLPSRFLQMCTTHLHHHPCSHVTPCLPGNVVSHCPSVQTRLWLYHDQPNQLPRLYPLQIPGACPPPPLLPQRPPPSATARPPRRQGETDDGRAHGEGGEVGNLCVWTVPWGCGRGEGPLCRVGWGDHSCPWVSGMAGRGGGRGGGGEGGGGGGRGGGGEGGGGGGRGGRGGRGGFGGVGGVGGVDRGVGRGRLDGVVGGAGSAGTGNVMTARGMIDIDEMRKAVPDTMISRTSPSCPHSNNSNNNTTTKEKEKEKEKDSGTEHPSREKNPTQPNHSQGLTKPQFETTETTAASSSSQITNPNPSSESGTVDNKETEYWGYYFRSCCCSEGEGEE